jgi:splicing factor 3B subunit 3
LAVCAFQDKLLVGVGKSLRLYEMGKKKLLRKSENKTFPTVINSIQAQGERLFVGDLCEAFHIVKYNKSDKSMLIVADNDHPRYLTASTVLDYNTIAGADKFGNIFISRLSPAANAAIVGAFTRPFFSPRLFSNLF